MNLNLTDALRCYADTGDWHPLARELFGITQFVSKCRFSNSEELCSEVVLMCIEKIDHFAHYYWQNQIQNPLGFAYRYCENLLRNAVRNDYHCRSKEIGYKDTIKCNFSGNSRYLLELEKINELSWENLNSEERLVIRLTHNWDLESQDLCYLHRCCENIGTNLFQFLQRYRSIVIAKREKQEAVWRKIERLQKKISQADGLDKELLMKRRGKFLKTCENLAIPIGWTELAELLAVSPTKSRSLYERGIRKLREEVRKQKVA